VLRGRRRCGCALNSTCSGLRFTYASSRSAVARATQSRVADDAAAATSTARCRSRGSRGKRPRAPGAPRVTVKSPRRFTPVGRQPPIGHRSARCWRRTVSRAAAFYCKSSLYPQACKSSLRLPAGHLLQVVRQRAYRIDLHLRLSFFPVVSVGSLGLGRSFTSDLRHTYGLWAIGYYWTGPGHGALNEATTGREDGTDDVAPSSPASKDELVLGLNGSWQATLRRSLSPCIVPTKLDDWW